MWKEMYLIGGGVILLTTVGAGVGSNNTKSTHPYHLVVGVIYLLWLTLTAMVLWYLLKDIWSPTASACDWF